MAIPAHIPSSPRVQPYVITRRTVLIHTAAAGVLAATSAGAAQNVVDRAALGSPIRLGKSARIKSVIRREETILNLGGRGDNYHMSWAADDRQYVSVCDGTGWFKNPRGHFNSRLWAIRGGPTDATFQEVPGYPDLIDDGEADVEVALKAARYYNYGTLALDGHIYQYLALEKYTDDPIKAQDADYYWSHARWYGAKLIYSPDNGRTWRNQDGSTPVVWEPIRRQSRANMVFYEEPQGAFWMLTVLQMGRNYEHNRDGYVYVYGHNGNTEGKTHEIVMYRVPKTRILQRDAYEFFAGIRRNGEASWSKDINAREIVNRAGSRGLWNGSVVYNAPLGLYMMSGTFNGPGGLGGAFGGDSNVTGLGFWTADKPWGPWTQIHEELPWRPGGDASANPYQPQIAPKWIAKDGKSLWLVWSDYRYSAAKQVDRELKDRKQELEGLSKPERFRRQAQIFHRYMSDYAFNAQRVDLSVA